MPMFEYAIVVLLFIQIYKNDGDVHVWSAVELLLHGETLVKMGRSNQVFPIRKLYSQSSNYIALTSITEAIIWIISELH